MIKILFSYTLIAFLFFVQSCTLKRDNPLDVHGTNIAHNFTPTHTSEISFSKYVVNSDNNNDGIVNPGETIGLQVFLKNNGSQQINKVRGTISCTSSFVTGLTPTSAQSYKYSYSYDYMLPDYDSQYGGYPNTNTVSFDVSNSTPTGTVLTFTISITDETNKTWNDTFNIVVQKISAAIQFSKFTVSSDNNNDSKVNKGESIGLQVCLKNTGSSQANKVRGTITSSSGYVSGLTPTSAQSYKYSYSYDYMLAGYDSQYGGYPNTNTISFNVSNSTPAGTVLPFNISITDEANNTWTDNFSVTVVSTDADIKYGSSTVNSDDNSNGLINPGETIGLQVILQNMGSSQANKVRGIITCSSSYISALTPTTAQSYKYSYSYDYMLAGYYSQYGGYPNTNTISFHVSSSTPVGTVLNFNISITDESNNTWSDSFSQTVY